LFIKSISFSDTDTVFSLSTLNLNQYNLLTLPPSVKTDLIIHYFNIIKNIALGESFNGVEWEIEFETDENLYLWKGAFSSVPLLDNGLLEEPDDKPSYTVAYESLFINNALAVEREGNKTFYYEGLIPTLPAHISVVRALVKDPNIANIFRAFRRVSIFEYTLGNKMPFRTFHYDEAVLLKQYQTLSQIISSQEESLAKLYLLKNVEPALFNQIIEAFVTIFPETQTIEVAAKKLKEDIPFFFPVVTAVLYPSGKRVSEQNLSLGFLRALAVITDAVLLPERSVFLITSPEMELDNFAAYSLLKILKELHPGNQLVVSSHLPASDAIEFTGKNLLLKDFSLNASE